MSVSPTMILAQEGATDAAKLDGSLAVPTNFNTNPVNISNHEGFSVLITVPATGTPNGTFKLQCSNDNGKSILGQVDYSAITNWVDIASGGDRVVSVAVAGAGGVYLIDPLAMYKWVRVVYTRTSGSITPTVKMLMKKSL